MNFLDGYKTYIGVFFVILGSVAQLAGWDWLGDTTGIQESLVTLIGGLIAAYGRKNAKL